MDYIDKIFAKHQTHVTRSIRIMTLQDFRRAVVDIEADHLKRVCKT